MRKCHEKTETIVEEVSRPVTRLVEQVSKVCRSFPWPFDLLCKVVVAIVEVVEWVVETVTRIVVTVVCVVVDLVEIVLSLASSLVHAVLSIPGIGGILRWIIDVVGWVVGQLAGLGEGIAGLIGFLPLKHLELWVVIQRDRSGLLISEADLAPVIAETERIFHARAKVRVHSHVLSLESAAPEYALDVPADAALFAGDLGELGSYYQGVITTHISSSNTSRLLRVGAPIVAFVVRDVAGSRTGCAIGPFTDWLVIEAQQFRPLEPTKVLPNTLAHEVGHSCGLLHDGQIIGDGDRTNLMFPNESADSIRGDNLSPFQRLIVRSSSHVTFF